MDRLGCPEGTIVFVLRKMLYLIELDLIGPLHQFLFICGYEIMRPRAWSQSTLDYVLVYHIKLQKDEPSHWFLFLSSSSSSPWRLPSQSRSCPTCSVRYRDDKSSVKFNMCFIIVSEHNKLSANSVDNMLFLAGGAVSKHRASEVSQRAYLQSVKPGQHRALLEDLQQVNTPANTMTWIYARFKKKNQHKLLFLFPSSRRDLNIDRNSTFK